MVTDLLELSIGGRHHTALLHHVSELSIGGKRPTTYCTTGLIVSVSLVRGVWDGGCRQP